MFLVIDNYDSFVHNLARYFERVGVETRVVRNDALSVEQIRDMAPEAIILSPGPCSPNEAGICLDVVRELGASIPMLGVCLGHQVIGQVYGGDTVRAKTPMHGKASQISHNGEGIFHGLPNFFKVGRYHSLVSDIRGSSELVIDALSDDMSIMAMHHKTHPVYGVQFHPESILTEYGIEIVRNFTAIALAQNAQTKQAA